MCKGREKSDMLMVMSIWGIDASMQSKKCWQLWGCEIKGEQYLLNQRNKFKWCHRTKECNSLFALSPESFCSLEENINAVERHH